MKKLIPILGCVAFALPMTIQAAAQAPAPRQAQAQPQSTPQQRLDLNALMNVAIRALQAIDQNRAGEIWDSFSAQAKSKVTKKDFVAQVNQARSPLGAVTERDWAMLERQIFPAGNAQIPPGQYITVRFAARFQTGAIKGEQVSFRLDEDGVWRVTGYSMH
ncbi:DUF4019 domain-containing protein [Sphingomonas cavernae]|uniref:DUF4019 domain-containing protein n=1 Tax=Sphingomonas cavernae TaxID=2320861 RepID=A0A418WJM9_9SPHN|nr:DUF4019 domain-containing protein [Sphingomonas cavernae]RJF90253.1 DUF4019 domain-containing protein [Sphingomonas cavernae]